MNFFALDDGLIYEWCVLKLLATLLLFCVSLSGSATRIVSTSPQATEFLFQIGVGDSIVGTTQYSFYPPQAKNIPTVGALFGQNLEKILRLRPDWIVLDRHNLSLELKRTLEGFSIKSFTIENGSPELLIESGRKLLWEIFQKAPSRSLVQAQACLKALPIRSEPTPYTALVWLDPPIVFGQQSFFSHLLRKLGYKNTLAHWIQNPFPQISLEWILQQKGKIFVLSEGSLPMEGTFLKKAVQRLDPNHFMRASLTPLRHLNALGLDAVPKECDAL